MNGRYWTLLTHVEINTGALRVTEMTYVDQTSIICSERQCLYCLVLFIHLYVVGFWVTAKLRLAVFTSTLRACLYSVLFQSSWTMSLHPNGPQYCRGMGWCVPVWGQRENPTFLLVCYSFIGFDCYSFTSCLIEKHGKSITSISGLFVVSWLGFQPDLKRQKCRQAFNAAMDEYTAFMPKVKI